MKIMRDTQDPKTPELVSASSSTTSTTSANPTVFIVDDDPGALESLRWMIQQADYPVKAFSSSCKFLDCCSSEASGCLVLDVRMPEMDGLALQQALRARNIRLPIIFITAYGDVPTCAAPSAKERSISWKSRSTTNYSWTTSKGSSPRRRTAAMETRASAIGWACSRPPKRRSSTP